MSSTTITEEIIFEEGFTIIDMDLPLPGNKRPTKVIIPATVGSISDRFVLSAMINQIGDFELCYCGTDEQWDAIVSKLGGKAAAHLNTVFKVTTNYQYDCTIKNADAPMVATGKVRFVDDCYTIETFSTDLPSDDVESFPDTTDVSETKVPEVSTEPDTDKKETKVTTGTEQTDINGKTDFWSNKQITVIIVAVIFAILAITVVLIKKKK